MRSQGSGQAKGCCPTGQQLWTEKWRLGLAHQKLPYAKTSAVSEACLKDGRDMPILITVLSRGILKLRLSLGGGRGKGSMQYMVPRGAVPTSYV